ncbi:MAG TPA: hypothetical protein DEO84_10325 [candidate division Zixibacteria bacterium]|nr:hypothetical protein [candidate division Zixibacteria bacterium]
MKVVRVLFSVVALLAIWSIIALGQSTLQGGDNISNAFPIPFIPFNDNGTTIGYTDDYSGNCGPAYGAPDVVYAYTPQYYDIIMASTCSGSRYDTRLYVFEDSPDNIIACDDDGCSNEYSIYVSRINCLPLEVGHTYYFVVDGYGSSSGQYTFDLTLLTPVYSLLQGTVTKSGDGPLSGVNIRVLQDGYIIWQDTTDDSGHYSAEDVNLGTYTVEASKTGYITQTSDPTYISICEPAQIDFALNPVPPPPIGIIAGYVWESDVITPIEGAIVTASPVDTNLVTADTTDSNGYYMLPDMQTVLYNVTASFPGRVSQEVQDVQVNSGETTTVYFALEIVHPPCIYVIGDVNNDGHFTGLDVTFSVRVFKGGAFPQYHCDCPPGSGNIWYVAGDVNGSCSFSGLDVTYSVRYFKGGPAPIPCPDCPPH